MPRMPQLPTSDTAQGMIQMLERQKAQHARAKMFKGQKPVSRPTRLERIQRQKGSVAYGAQMRVQIGSMVQHSIVSYVYPPSVAPLRQLAKMRIDELLLETNHRGRYLLLRTISQANKMTAVMAVVEDDSGRKDNVELLSLYNCLDDLQVKYLDDWIPKGTILIVKEPYYKLTADGNASIRVDHVSDVLFLEPVSNGEIAHCALRDCHEVGSGDLVKIGINLPVDWIPAKDQKSIQTPTELKDAGNFAYKRGNYYQAVKW